MEKLNIKKKREEIIIFSLIIILICGISFTDAFLSPPYFLKSLIKIVLFGIIPIAVLLLKGGKLSEIFVSDRKASKLSAILGAVLVLLILLLYYLLRGAFDFSAVTKSLTEDEGITKEVFPIVFLYIAFVNSFLEEFFFRFFANKFLGRFTSGRFAFVFSALAFALYHVAIMDGWFSSILTLLLIVGLTIGGVIFNFLDRKGGILPSWILHVSANIAINTVGMILFYTQ